MPTAWQRSPKRQQDHHALKAIQAELADKHLLPQQHLVDAGYMSAKRILESRDTHGVDLLGPVPVDPSWQAHTPGAFAVSRFHIDWEHQVVTCPQGERSSAWHRGKDAKGESVVQVCFAQPTCQACSLRPHCTKAQATERSMTLRFPAERHEMLQAARARQQTPEFHAVYQARCGIEGTFAQTTRTTGMRRARYTSTLYWPAQDPSSAPLHRLGHQYPAARVLAGGHPIAKTRTSRFAALAA
jgi:transposase